MPDERNRPDQRVKRECVLAARPANSGAPNARTTLRDRITAVLQRSGFSDIHAMPSSFVVHAKDQDGNPVVMSITPDSVAENRHAERRHAERPHAERRHAEYRHPLQWRPAVRHTLNENQTLSSNLIGLNVYNNSNQNIGQIKDVALDPEGEAKAYIVSVGGFLGVGTRYVALNPNTVKVSFNDSDKKWHATTNASADQLKAAPSASKS